MERRNFNKMLGLSTLGLISSGNILAATYKSKSYELLEIKIPNIHVRHGNFNLQIVNKIGLQIQRDVFNRNGLASISENRIVSVKITDHQKEIFGIQDEYGFKCQSNALFSVNLSANKEKHINIESESVIFSELDTIIVDGKEIKNNHAFVRKMKGALVLISKTNQSVFVYTVEK